MKSHEIPWNHLFFLVQRYWHHFRPFLQVSATAPCRVPKDSPCRRRRPQRPGPPCRARRWRRAASRRAKRSSGRNSSGTSIPHSLAPSSTNFPVSLVKLTWYIISIYWCMVVDLARKMMDWVRQLGWWHSQYMEKQHSCSKPPIRSIDVWYP